MGELKESGKKEDCNRCGDQSELVWFAYERIILPRTSSTSSTDRLRRGGSWTLAAASRIGARECNYKAGEVSVSITV